MRSLIAILLALWLTPLWAQVPMTGAGLAKPSSGASCASALSNLLINLDASNSASVIRSGSNVSAWNDLSGNGYNFTATNSPQYSATGFNTSYPGISFTASSSMYLTASSVSLNTTTLSVFVVMNFSSSSNNIAGAVSILGSGKTNDYNNNESLAFTVRSFAANYRITRNAFNISTTSAYNTPATAGVVFDGTNGTTYLDFTAGTPTASTGTFGSTTATFVIAARQQAGINTFLDGTIAEVIITTGAVSGTPLTNLHTCLTAKWGVP